LCPFFFSYFAPVDPPLSLFFTDLCSEKVIKTCSPPQDSPKLLLRRSSSIYLFESFLPLFLCVGVRCFSFIFFGMQPVDPLSKKVGTMGPAVFLTFFPIVFNSSRLGFFFPFRTLVLFLGPGETWVSSTNIPPHFFWRSAPPFLFHWFPPARNINLSLGQLVLILFWQPGATVVLIAPFSQQGVFFFLFSSFCRTLLAPQKMGDGPGSRGFALEVSGNSSFFRFYCFDFLIFAPIFRFQFSAQPLKTYFSSDFLSPPPPPPPSDDIFEIFGKLPFLPPPQLPPYVMEFCDSIRFRGWVTFFGFRLLPGSPLKFPPGNVLFSPYLRILLSPPYRAPFSSPVTVVMNSPVF